MVLYMEGTKVWSKTKCTPGFKMQWEPCVFPMKGYKLRWPYNLKVHTVNPLYNDTHYNSKILYTTVMCLSIGTPKNNKFSICSKWKIYYF